MKNTLSAEVKQEVISREFQRELITRPRMTLLSSIKPWIYLTIES